METHTTTLVLGGTGKTGRRISDRLRARGVPTRVGSRAGQPPFDWEDRATWSPTLDDAAAVYVAFSPDLAVPGAADAVGALATLAAAHGVERLVLLSGRGEPEAQRAEQAVRAAFPGATVLRASWFNQNFSEGTLLDGVVDGVREPFLDADDIADAAVAALTQTGHQGRLYELTGPRLLTFAEAVGAIAEASGRELRFEPLSIDAYTALLAEYEVPGDVVWLLTYLFTEVLDGRNAHLSDGVRRALGREPRDFREYARDTAASGVWAGAAQVAR